MDTSDQTSVNQETAPADRIPPSPQSSPQTEHVAIPTLAQAEPTTDRRARLTALESRIAEIEAEIVAMEEPAKATNSSAVAESGGAK